jgi:hypothetical protein
MRPVGSGGGGAAGVAVEVKDEDARAGGTEGDFSLRLLALLMGKMLTTGRLADLKMGR